MSEVSGIIESVNSNGVKLQGQDKWFNYTKFNPPAPMLGSDRGKVVVLDTNKGYIQGYRFEGGSSSVVVATPGADPAAYVTVNSRDTSIVRQAMIKAACDYGAGYNPIEVIQIASLFERWVNRTSEDTLEELASEAEQWGFLRQGDPIAIADHIAKLRAEDDDS